MKMEKEEIARRLREASRKNKEVTITVRTGKYETQEVPLLRSGVRKDATGEFYENWGLTERDPAAEGETRKRNLRARWRGHAGEDTVAEVWKKFIVTDRKGNETIIMERYRMENVEEVEIRD